MAFHGAVKKNFLDIMPPPPGKIRKITYFQKPKSASNEGNLNKTDPTCTSSSTLQLQASEK